MDPAPPTSPPAAPPGRPATLGQRLSQRLIRLFGQKTVFLIVLATLIGVGAGYGAIFFRWLIDSVNDLVYPAGISLDALASLPWYVLVLIPAAGGLVVGPLVYFLAREAKGHGVPEVMDAVSNQGGRIRPRVGAVKTLASAVSIGVGASVGREGPIVQIGSALGSTVGQLLDLDTRALRLLVGCGAAAGIAATFNAPLAGALFAMEVILGVGTVQTFTPLVVASVAATAISRHYMGDDPAFDVPVYQLVSAWELGLYAILGLVSAFVAVAFSRGLYLVEDLWDRIPFPEWAKPVLGGLLIGAMALLVPHVMGVGYESISGVLTGDGGFAIPLMLGLVAAKILATHLSLGAGFSGGVFAPSLFIGAMLGGAFGLAMGALLPSDMVAPSGAYAVVAMGAVVAATTHAPLTAILIVFEMTSDHRIIVPLMLSCLVASTLSVKLSHESIYTLKLVRRGSRVGHSDEQEVMRQTRVEALMRPTTTTLSPATPLPRIVQAVLAAGAAPTWVVREDDTLEGVITMDDISPVIHEGEMLGNIVIAADVMRPAVDAVRPDDTLARVLGGLTRQDVDMLPVVDADARLLGAIARADVLAHYDREVLRKDAPSLTFLAPRSGGPKPAGALRAASGERIDTIPVAGDMVGETLRSLDFRARWGVQVLGVREGDGKNLRVLDPSEPLADGAKLVVVGRESQIREAKQALESTGS